MEIDVNNELTKMQGVFQRPAYLFISLTIAGIAFAFYALLLNYQLLIDTALAGNYQLLTGLIPSLIAGYPQTTTMIAVTFTVLISLAIGVNFALVAFRLIEMQSFGRDSASSLGGMVFAVLAPACPACATTIVAFAGVSSLFAVLPFNGTEFQLLALLLLTGSAFWISSQINQQYCEFC